MAVNRTIGGKVYYSGGWYYQQTAARGAAAYHRRRGFLARVVRERQSLTSSRMGYGVYLRGKGR